jgi:PAS domain S-box-containing protein
MADLPFLSGGGEVGERMRETDWGATPLGPAEHWPPALRTVVGLMLASNQPMYVAWGPTRAFLYNDHYAPFLGDKHPSALGRDLLAEVWPEIRGQLEPLVEATRSGEPVQVPRMQLELRRHGRLEETHFSFFFAPIREEDGSVGGLFGCCNEITGQVLSERRLARSLERHLGVLSNMDEAFVLMDREFRLLEVNDEAVRLLRKERRELIGAVQWELFPGTRESALGRLYRQVLDDGVPDSIEFPYGLVDGAQHWFEIRVFPAEEGIAVLFRDITRRRQEAAQAQLAAERVQLALDAGAIVGTWMWSIPDDRFIGDERFASMFGIDRKRCEQGLPLAEVMAPIHPEDVQRVEVAVERAMARGGPYQCEYRVRRHDGSFVWVEANGRVELDARGEPIRFPGVLRDHTERRRAERDRDRATAMLRSFVEAVPGVVYAKDREGRLILGNRGVAELLGVPQEQYVGRTDRELIADQVQAEAVMRNDRRIMESGVAEQVEEEIRLADGTPAWWWSHKAPLLEGGEVVGLVGASVDITERRRMMEALEQGDRRKDEFLAMLAHELRNPLAPIGTAAQLLRMAPADPSTVGKAADIIVRQVEHMTQMVDDLLDVSRVTRGLVQIERAPLDLREVVSAAVEQADPFVQSRGHRLRVDAAIDGAVVMGDRHRLVQVICNLLNNAAKYTPPGGTISLALAASADEVEISVADTGIGMGAELVPQVFDLFTQAERTPDRSQGGLGIGLALVRSIVQLHGGKVSASSPGPGRGSTFTVSLPRASVKALPLPPARAVAQSGCSRNVMVVDDNIDAATTLASVLRVLGHRVSVAADGRDALARAAERHDWDAFILDIGMPDMTGHELAARLRQVIGRRPARFIALSGYGQANDVAASRAAGFDHHMVKPADVAELHAMLCDPTPGP